MPRQEKAKWKTDTKRNDLCTNRSGNVYIGKNVCATSVKNNIVGQ
jgi:hypothetical protein